jgi:hypothetical protein
MAKLAVLVLILRPVAVGEARGKTLKVKDKSV